MKIVNEILVDNMEVAINFYKNILNFLVYETTGDPINWALLKNDSSEIMLEDYKSAKAEFSNFPLKNASCNLIKFKYGKIETVKKIYEKVVENNIKIMKDFIKTDYGTTEFAIIDPDENIIIVSD